MVKVKVIRVEGQVITRNGRRASDLFERIERELGQFLSDIDPKNVVSVTQDINSGGTASGGDATYTITYKADEAGRKEK